MSQAALSKNPPHATLTCLSLPRHSYVDSWQAYQRQCHELLCPIDWEREHAREKATANAEMSLLWKPFIQPEDLVALPNTSLCLSLTYSLDLFLFFLFIYLRYTYCKTFLVSLFDLSPWHSYSCAMREGSFASRSWQIGATILHPSMSAIAMSAAESNLSS
jgi:hypothetical protein